MFNNIVTGSSVDFVRLGRSSQESRKRGTLTAFQVSQTIIVSEFLGLRAAGLGGFLVVEVWDRGGVEGRVKEDRGWGCGSSSADVSKAERLGLICERRVSLAGWWCLSGLQSQATKGQKSISGT